MFLSKHILQLLEEALALFVVLLFQGALKLLQGIPLGLVQLLGDLHLTLDVHIAPAAAVQILDALATQRKTAARKTLEVSIPMGIDDDQSFALRGMGDAGANGGPAGDVIVMVTVRPSEVFQRDGYDVWVTVPSPTARRFWATASPCLDRRQGGGHCARGTQSGTTFRLRGKGIQYLNGRGRGDMYVRCEVEIPKKLSKTQRDALKKFEGTLKEENYEKRKASSRS